MSRGKGGLSGSAEQGTGNAESGYRPSVILLGRPVSQPLGVFHGRTEALSVSSVVEHAFSPTAKTASNSSKTQRGCNASLVTIPDGQGLPGRLPLLRPIASLG